VQVGSSTSWSDSELYFFFDTLAPILLVEFTPDAYPQEIHWDLYRAPGDYSGDSYVHVQSDEVYDFEPTYPAEWRLQLAAGAFFYFLLVSDRGSDGICCAYGQGSLRVHISGREVAPASTSWSEMEFDSSTEVRLVYYFDSFPPTTILRVKITPDSKPEEIYWILYRINYESDVYEQSGEVYDFEPTYPAVWELQLVTNAYYKLLIYDRGSDGFCCAHGQGSVRVEMRQSGQEVCANPTSSQSGGLNESTSTSTSVMSAALGAGIGAGAGVALALALALAVCFFYRRRRRASAAVAPARFAEEGASSSSAAKSKGAKKTRPSLFTSVQRRDGVEDFSQAIVEEQAI